MAKKKNTRSAERADILAVALCLAGAVLCLTCFYLDLNRSLRRYNEQPLGTVSWKRRAAQRRFADRVLWDRLKQDSLVYSGDYIRTGELSAALVNFTSGSAVEVAENSLIHIMDEDNTTRLQISGGAVSVSARDTDVLIVSGKNSVRVHSGGRVRAGAEGDGEALQVRVDEGTARVSGGGSVREAAAGEGFSLSSGAPERSGADIPVSAAPPNPSPPVLFSPGEGEVLRYQNQLPEIRFRWSGPSGEEPPPEYYILEAADNPALENPALSLQSRVTSVSASVPAPGLWYWRVRPVYQGPSGTASPAGTRGSFLVEEGPLPAPPPRFVPPPEDNSLRAIFPPGGYTVAEALLPDLRFTWKAPAGEARFQVSAGEDFARPELDEPVSGRTWQIRRLAPGDWYWRVSAGGQVSPPRRFTVASPLGFPAPVGGDQNIRAGQNEAVFRWQPVEGAAYYEFRLYEGQSGRLLHSRTLAGTSAGVSLAAYEDGPYRWTVQAFAGQTPDATRQESLPAVVQFEVKRTPVEAASRPEASAVPAQTQTASRSGPLRAPRLGSPANDLLFDADRLRGISGISFSWAAVDGADGYTFVLLSAGNREILSARTATPSYTLNDLSILNNGRFRWQVRALRRGPAGEEHGPAAEAAFTVDIPELRPNRLEDIGTMYGR
jgi:hypothetical protein